MKSWVRGEHPECFTEAQKAAEFIFPKLAESNDERVRKVLIDYFNRYKEQEKCGVKTFYGIPTGAILAWLEKQGDKPKKVEDEEYDGEDYGIDGLWHAKDILEKTLGKVDGYQSDDGILEHKCAITAVKKLYEKGC